MSQQIVLIPFGTEFIALPQDTFQEGIERGRQITGANVLAQEHAQQKLIDAKQAAELTGIKKSWFLEQARQGKIPHYQMGKYIRFSMPDLQEALKVRSQKN